VPPARAPCGGVRRLVAVTAANGGTAKAEGTVDAMRASLEASWRRRPADAGRAGGGPRSAAVGAPAWLAPPEAPRAVPSAGDDGWQGALMSVARLGISFAMFGELMHLMTAGGEAHTHRAAFVLCGWLLLRPLLKAGRAPR